MAILFQSTPSAWRETPLLYADNKRLEISIHSLRMEGDCNAFKYLWRHDISIHSLRMEGDFYNRHCVLLWNAFQSTPSAWRETRCFQNILLMFIISIHSLRMEGDRAGLQTIQKFVISIHSLRMEGDIVHRVPTTAAAYFNPLPPHGGRPLLVYCAPAQYFTFQSTPSAWRETSGFCGQIEQTRRISIHSLRMEGDAHMRLYVQFFHFHFNPLPPHGGRPSTSQTKHHGFPISIHSLRMEGDAIGTTGTTSPGNFNPLPPHGGRPTRIRCTIEPRKFQSTPSAWRETEFG